MGDSISLFLLPLPSNLASLSVYDLRTTGKKKKKMGFGKYFLGICLMGLTLIDVSLAAGGLNSPKDYVDIHNEARKNVSVGPVTWDKKLEKYAPNYANKKANSGCEMEHSNGPYGENLGGGYDDTDGVDAVKFWLTEKDNYDHDSNQCVGDDECGHYTQVVWRDTKRIGCARVKCKGNSIWWFIICSYDPPGNYLGEKPY